MSLINRPSSQIAPVPPKDKKEAFRLKALTMADRILYFFGIGCIILALFPAINLTSAILRTAVSACACLLLLFMSVLEFKWSLPQRNSSRKKINLLLLFVSVLLLAWFLYTDFGFWTSLFQ